MARRKEWNRAAKTSVNRWLLAGMLSLIVLGAAVSAGSAIGKNDASTAAVDTGLSTAPPNNGKLAYQVTVVDLTGKVTAAFEIKDFSFGVENPTTIGSATGGAGAGKANFSEFTITKPTDQASPAFFKNCVTGAHYKTVTLEMRKAGGDPASAGKPFQRFTFGTVFTTKIDWSGPGDEGPEESITFVYGSLKVEYVPQDPANATSFEWNQVQNREP